MNKNVIKRLSAVIILMLTIALVIISESTGTKVAEGITISQLMKEAGKATWYDFKPSDLVGKRVGINVEPYELLLKNGYCADAHMAIKQNGKYEAVNIFDINNKTNKVVVYSAENPGKGIEYDLSDPKVKPIIMLGYLEMMADKDPSNVGQGSYKNVMVRMLNSKTWLGKLKQVGLYKGFINYDNNDSLLNGTVTKNRLKEAERYAEQIQANGGIEDATLKLSMTQAQKDSVGIIIEGGKTYIGPYKVSKSSACTIGEITVNGNKKAAGISTDLKKVVSVEKVANEKEFYVVLNEELDTVTSVSMKAKKAIATLKSRMVLVGNSLSQNFIIWKSEETYNQPEISLPKATSATLQMLKEDEVKGSNLDLSNIGFMVWSVNKKAYIQVNKNGKIEYTDFATAKKNEFKTGKDGKTQVIKNLPVGKYKIYETSIPSKLEQYYKLPEISMPEKGGDKTVKTTGKSVIVNGKDYVDLKAGQTAPVTATNKRDYVPEFRIQKVDKTTGKALKGIEFRLYGKIDGKEGWITTDKNNKVTGTTVDGDKAAKLITGTDGWTPKITRIPVGKYSIYETGLGEYEGVYEDLQPIRINGGNTGVLGVFKGTYDIKATKDNEFTVKLDNTQVYIDISGFVWQDNPVFDENKNEDIRDDIKDSKDYMIDGIEVKLMDKTTKQVVKNKDGKELKAITSNGGKYKFKNVRFQEKQQDGSYKNILANYYVEFTYDGVTYQNVVTPSDVTDVSKTSKAQETTRQEFNDIFTEITGEGQVLNGVKLTYTKKDGKVYSNNIAQRDVNTKNKLVSISKAGDFTLSATTADKYLLTTYNKLSDSGKKVISEITNVNLGVYERSQSAIDVIKDVHSAKLSINGFNHIYTYGTKTEEYKKLSKDDLNVAVQFKKNLILEGADPYNTPVYRSDYKYTSDDKSKELKVSIIYRIRLENNSDYKKLLVRVNSVVDYFDKKYENIEVGKGLDESKGTITDKLTYTIDSSYNDPKYAKAIINTGIDVKESEDIYVKFDLSKENVGILLDTDNELLENSAEVNSYTVKEENKLYAAFDMYSIPANADPNKPQEYEKDTDKAPGLKLEPKDDRTMSGVVFEDDAISGGAGQERLGNGQYDNGEKTIPGVKVKLVETDKDGKAKADGKTYEAAQDTTEDGVFNISGYVPGYYKVIYTWGDNETYNVKDYKGTIFLDRDTSKMDWYKNDNRYSDAMDDYQLRLAIDNNVTTTYSDLTKMNSSTPLFGIGIEYGAGTPGDNITTISTGDSFVRCDVSTMDFGIIQRPHQTMEIDKHVKGLKVTDTAGKPLVDAIVNSEGKLEGKYDSAVSGVTGGKDLGFFKVEMDNELIQDSTAEVEYEITVKNTSEIDYDSEAYYLYGRRDGNELNIKLKATGVYDYLFGSNSDGNKNNSIWNSVPVDVIKTLDISKVQDRTVLDYIANNLTKELSPTEEVSERFFSNKPLTTSGEISLENSTEIKSMETTSTSGTTGGEGTTRLGIRREPQVQFSKLFAEAERVTVTPPTGGNKDYTTVIIISIAAIAILGTGIILIKKKVLSK